MLPSCLRIDAAVIVQGVPASPDLRDALLSACSDLRKARVCMESEEGETLPADNVSADADIAKTIAIITWPDGTCAT
jgi:hypothetical protein